MILREGILLGESTREHLYWHRMTGTSLHAAWEMLAIMAPSLREWRLMGLHGVQLISLVNVNGLASDISVGSLPARHRAYMDQKTYL
jgi:hypothetical protein